MNHSGTLILIQIRPFVKFHPPENAPAAPENARHGGKKMYDHAAVRSYIKFKFGAGNSPSSTLRCNRRLVGVYQQSTGLLIEWVRVPFLVRATVSRVH